MLLTTLVHLYVVNQGITVVIDIKIVQVEAFKNGLKQYCTHLFRMFRG